MTALEARDLGFGYPGSPSLFDGWDARFEAGEMVAVTGASGRGKSTLLYLLGLMLVPRRGRVLLDGVVVSGGSDRERSARRAHDFGFVFQDAALDASRPVLDNVLESTLYRRTSRRAERRRALDLLDALGVAARADARPGQISGGQAQRIAVARALLSRPRVLLADEPTGNLDPASAGVVLGALREHSSAGGVVVIVTHDRSVVERCDRAIGLE